nr:MAG TPA_asm: hypothetical protein [Caudoviricetes sp.]
MPVAVCHINGFSRIKASIKYCIAEFCVNSSIIFNR